MDFSRFEYKASYGTGGQLESSVFLEIVLCGRSNVGKSSLINALCGRKNLARVSSSPGKTATVNFYTYEDVALCDLPGYGFAKRSGDEKKRWSNLMERYFTSGRNIVLALQLVDSRREPTPDDADMMKFLRAYNIPFVVVLTKWDKLNVTQKKTRQKEIEEELRDSLCLSYLTFSATKREGVEELREIIGEFLKTL